MVKDLALICGLRVWCLYLYVGYICLLDYVDWWFGVGDCVFRLTVRVTIAAGFVLIVLYLFDSFVLCWAVLVCSRLLVVGGDLGLVFGWVTMVSCVCCYMVVCCLGCLLWWCYVLVVV